MRTAIWQDLDESQRQETLQRPPLLSSAELTDKTLAIINRVRSAGDRALTELTESLDGVRLSKVEAGPGAAASPELLAAMRQAVERIGLFHQAGKPVDYRVRTAPGIECHTLYRPLVRVGLYVPGGSAPLISTVLMLGIPAKIAGCREIVLCSPPNADGAIAPEILAAAELCGVRRIFAVGGAQAIAAMAYGTESIPRCDKLFGPGNAWVTEAKRLVAADPQGPRIDMPAGPSEVLVIADRDADPELVALDLLAQAEHGPDSQVILLSTCSDLIAEVCRYTGQLAAELPRSDILVQSLEYARAVLCRDIAQAIDISNRYAPEHLILNVARPASYLDRIEHAGSVFLGRWTPESLGDYCSGTNHVLPTAGYARTYSGLSVRDFMKSFTVQQASAEGLLDIGPAAETMARAESLEAHRLAVAERRRRLLEQ